MTNRIPFALWIATLPIATLADSGLQRSPLIPAYTQECGACHLAFPPALLTASDWRTVMTSLNTHYGDNASLDAEQRRSIEAFLIANAGDAAKVGAGRTANANESLPRLTRTAWFARKHHEVSRADWESPKLGSRANCAGCHPRATEASYREREIRMPDGRRWED